MGEMTEQKENTVNVDDNFHYMQEEHRYTQGRYATEDEALTVCHQIADEFLAGAYKTGMSADKLFERYVCFGDDPWVDGIEFSAWTYAKERCLLICASNDVS